jgi:hypothetical protein
MAVPKDQLPGMAQEMWQAFSAGKLTEAEAEDLGGLIATRQTKQTTTPTPRVHVGSRPRSDASMERCRRWAAAGRMPPGIACKFTQGEQAALAVVAIEVTKRQTCAMAIGAIAAIAGVSTSTVKRAIRQARALGFLTVQERRLSRFRSETNIIRIIAKAWTSWLELRGSKGGVQNCTSTSTSDPLKRRQGPCQSWQKVFGGPERRPAHTPNHQSPRHANGGR